MPNDFKELRDAIHNEAARRGKTITTDTYSTDPATGVKILLEHAQKVFDDCKVVDSTKNYVINVDKFVKANDFGGAITYIQTLMNQCLY